MVELVFEANFIEVRSPFHYSSDSYIYEGKGNLELLETLTKSVDLTLEKYTWTHPQVIHMFVAGA